MNIKPALKSLAGRRNALLTFLIFSLLTFAALCPASAGEPLAWERVPNRPAPAQFDSFHGETLDFRCTFTGFGELPFAGGGAVAPRLWYQTNGMGAAWWSVPATVASNVLAAAWPPSADPGAERVSFFFGAPSNAYAAAQVRFRHSPGGTPNKLNPPDVLDWMAELSAATNALAASSAAAYMPQSNAYTKAETDARIVELAPPGLNTNDVVGIVTATATIWTAYLTSPGFDGWAISQNDATVIITDVAWEGSTVSYTANDEHKSFDLEGNLIYDRIATDRDVYLYIETNDQIPIGSNPDAWRVNIGTTGGFDDAPQNLFSASTNNALGLATLYNLSLYETKAALSNDVAGIVTNTVTKWVIKPPTEWVLNETPSFDGLDRWWVSATHSGVRILCYASGDAQDTLLHFIPNNPAEEGHGDFFVELIERNALGLARTTDLTNYVSKPDGIASKLNIGVNNTVTGTRAVASGTNNIASGVNSISIGRDNTANNATTIAMGRSNTASGPFAIAAGTGAVASNSNSYVWNNSLTRYGSHGSGTYSVNSQNGIYGFFIGQQNLYDSIASALSQTNRQTVSFFDDEDNVESTRTITPLPVLRESDIAPLQNSVNAMWATMYGESVWIAVTNYMRTIAGTVPSLRLWEVRDNNTNLVYSSAEEIEHVTTQKVNAAEARLAAKMPRTAWGSYQSSGEDNPSSNTVTVINSQKIMLTGGGEWYRTIETGGASVWVLKSNGLTTSGGDTNGYFRVCDAEGNAQFEVVKTADQVVDAIASDVDFDGDGNFTVTFNASGSTHPTISCATDLGDDFIEEDASGNINSLGITVTWAQNANNLWVATIHQDTRAEHLFVYGKVLMAGSNLVRNNAPTSIDGGIYINNIRYRLVPYTTGGKTYLTLEAW